MIRKTLIIILLLSAALNADDYFASFTITDSNEIKIITAAFAFNKTKQFQEEFANSIYAIEVMKTMGPDPSQGDILLFKSMRREYNLILTINPNNDNPDPNDKMLWVQFIENPRVSEIIRRHYQTSKRKLIDPSDISINPTTIALNDSVRIFYNKQNQLHLSGDEAIIRHLLLLQNQYIKFSFTETDSIWQLTPEVDRGDTLQETMPLSIPVYTSLYYKDQEVIDNFTPTVKAHPKYFNYKMVASSTTQPIVTDYLPAFDVSTKDTIWLEYIAEDGKRISGPIYVHGCFEEKEIITDLGRKETHYVPCDLVESDDQLVTVPPTYIQDDLTDFDSKRNYPVWIPKILKDRLNIETDQEIHPLLKYIPLCLGCIVIILLSV